MAGIVGEHHGSIKSVEKSMAIPVPKTSAFVPVMSRSDSCVPKSDSHVPGADSCVPADESHEPSANPRRTEEDSHDADAGSNVAESVPRDTTVVPCSSTSDAECHGIDTPFH